jgi:hypothetical protein
MLVCRHGRQERNRDRFQPHIRDDKAAESDVTNNILYVTSAPVFRKAGLLPKKTSNGGSVPENESNGIASRFDKPFAFSGTPSMNDTSCQNEQGAHRAMP